MSILICCIKFAIHISALLLTPSTLNMSSSFNSKFDLDMMINKKFWVFCEENFLSFVRNYRLHFALIMLEKKVIELSYI